MTIKELKSIIAEADDYAEIFVDGSSSVRDIYIDGDGALTVVTNTNTYSPYDCPTCGWEPPAFEGKYYHIKGKKYPVFSDANRYFNGSFDMNDWDETHYCSKCKKEFTFTNGSV